MVSDEDAIHHRVTQEEAGRRLDVVLSESVLPHASIEKPSRATVQRWIADGRVLVNGKPGKPKDKMRVGMELMVRPDQPPPTDAQPDASVVLDVVYEDAELLVVNKPAGLVVHPGRGHMSGTLVNGLLARPGFERAAVDPRDPAGQLRPGIVHRIDKDTSGLLVVAKRAGAREFLKEQLSSHSMEREYQALTVGVPSAGTIETLHGRDPHSRLRFSSKVQDGKRAVTHIEVREVCGGNRAAWVVCRLETGRTHQIRVHLSQERRTPLLADELYGGMRGSAEIVAIAQQLGRQALHARVLGFVHPNGERLRFEAPLPEDMSLALTALRQLQPLR